MKPPLPIAAMPQATASRRVTTVLIRAILEGDFQGGQKLPTEREMAERFDVSRHVVREALKRLETMGLVQIRQGSGAHISDVGLTGGIELFEYLVFDEEGNVDFKVLLDYVQFYSHFAREVVRLAALNRSEEDVAEMRQALEERAKSLDNLPKLVAANQFLFQLFSRSTGNRFYHLVFNNLGRIALRLRQSVSLARLDPLTPQGLLENLVDAVAAQDAERAAQLAEDMMGHAGGVLKAFHEMKAAQRAAS